MISSYLSLSLMSLATGIATFFLSRVMVKTTMPLFLKAGLKGVDLNKGRAGKDKGPIPEALGLVSGFIFLMGTTTLVGLIPYNEVRVREDMLAALVSISFMLLLGFTDDVLDLRWRYKLILPLFAALPSISIYNGPTLLPFPYIFKSIFGTSDIGGFYRLILLGLTLFAGNAVNIYAGINGLEIGQSIIAAIAIVIRGMMKKNIIPTLILIPFIGASFGLLHYNHYPSRCFVGDTFTYSAGMALAVSSFIGGFPLELLFYMLPELLNFIISLPQLLKIVPCPRHRLPRYNEETEKMERMPGNWTLINFYLWVRGPLEEKRLCAELLCLQGFLELIILVLAHRGWLNWLDGSNI